MGFSRGARVEEDDLGIRCRFGGLKKTEVRIEMAVRMRLARQGGKKKPFYRIIVADSEAPRDGAFIEAVGTYDPMGNPPKVEINSERVSFWLSRGATPTDTVRELLKKTDKKENTKAA